MTTMCCVIPEIHKLNMYFWSYLQGAKRSKTTEHIFGEVSNIVASKVTVVNKRLTHLQTVQNIGLSDCLRPFFSDNLMTIMSSALNS